jgi:ubiquinone/menaquinone biosynthesis C-methylase UbiE
MQAAIDYNANTTLEYAESGWKADPDMTNAFVDEIPSCLDGKVVLDLGCGGGELINNIMSTRGSAQALIGMDVCPEFIKAAKASIPVAKKEVIKFIEANMDVEIPLPVASVDLVVSRFVFHYSKDIVGLCRSVARVLKPNGQLILLTNSFSGSDAALGNWIPIRLSPVLLLQNYAHSIEAYMAALKDAGFTDITCDSKDASEKIDQKSLCKEHAGVRVAANVIIAGR